MIDRPSLKKQESRNEAIEVFRPLELGKMAGVVTVDVETSVGNRDGELESVFEYLT